MDDVIDALEDTVGEDPLEARCDHGGRGGGLVVQRLKRAWRRRGRDDWGGIFSLPTNIMRGSRAREFRTLLTYDWFGIFRGLLGFLSGWFSWVSFFPWSLLCENSSGQCFQKKWKTYGKTPGFFCKTCVTGPNQEYHLSLLVGI